MAEEDTIIEEDNSELYVAKRPVNFTDDCLVEVGITTKQDKISAGFMKVLPSDFIVEEISPSGEISTVETASIETKDDESEKPQIEFDLVKENIATVEAVKQIAEKLSIEKNQIKYAGLKDSKAITSQKVAVGNIEREKIVALSIPNILIKNIRLRKGSIDVGGIKGNRFTILIRTEGKDSEKLLKNIQTIESRGFANFYSLQRFGTRLISHEIGKEIINNNCEEASKILFFRASDHEMKKYGEIREQAEVLWLSWPEIRELFEVYPSYFAAEISILKSLESGSNFFQAFKAQEWTTSIFIRAYTSYLLNKVLSIMTRDNDIPDDIPLVSQDDEIIDFYKAYLPDEDFNWENIKSFPLGYMGLDKMRSVQSMIKPKIDKVLECEEGYVFVFELDKGAYATTFLANFFELMQFGDRPSWLNTEKVDTLKMLGRESVYDIEEKLNSK